MRLVAIICKSFVAGRKKEEEKEERIVLTFTIPTYQNTFPHQIRG